MDETTDQIATVADTPAVIVRPSRDEDVDAIAGRIATTPFVVYPPGIAAIVPGERLTERARPMLDYLRMFEACFNAFPGFEVEIQGVYREVEASGRVRLHTYVVAE